MKDLNENSDNNNKGFFVALTSIVTVCIIIFFGIIIFFPNKNLDSDIAGKNIILEKKSKQNSLENEQKNTKSLEVSETPNEIIIDLTRDFNKNKNVNKDNITTIQQKQINETTKNMTNKKIIVSQKPKINKKQKNSINKEISNIDSKYDPHKEYYIQFVSLSDPNNADNYIQKLLKYNINAKIYSVIVNNKDIYRVRSGPYKTKLDAKLDFKKIAGISEFQESYILPINK